MNNNNNKYQLIEYCLAISLEKVLITSPYAIMDILNYIFYIVPRLYIG